MRRSLYCVLIAVVFLLFAGCAHREIDTSPVLKAEEGYIDLSKLHDDRIIRLNGEWEFYWERKGALLDNKQYIEVPSNWKSALGLPGHGYATYRLVIEGLKEESRYGLTIPAVSNAYQLFIDGNLAAEVGAVGTDKDSTVPDYQPQEVYFSPNDTSTEVTMVLANYHYRSGGIWESITIGTAEQILDRTYKKQAFEFIIFGCLLLAGLYHSVLYIQRRKNVSALLFSLVCFIICIRIIVTEEMAILDFFPSFPWSLIIKLEYLTFYTSVPLFCWVLYSLFPNLFSKRYFKVFTFISAVMSLFVLVTTTNIFTHSTVIYQVLTIITILYVSIKLVKALIDKQEGALIVNICAAILSITVINDILSVNSVIQSYRLSSLGLAVFIFSQAYIIAKRSTKAFNEMERMTTELALLNLTLEEKVKERTVSLENSRDQLQKVNEKLKNLSYRDQLTQIPNRRYFDEKYHEAWDAALMNKSPIAVMYLDIDYFKLYNDTYGHEAGDECLKLVAQSIEEIIQSCDGFVARMGGEEFIAVLLNQSPESIYQLAEKCRTMIEGLNIPHENSKVSNRVTLSIGAAMSVANAKGKAADLISEADECLYEAKENGRNSIYIKNAAGTVSTPSA
ncbi:sensor domain-containing diguanylate cyclase [Bacillus sp. SG-1]|uniref:sensor domain-containing diguanylate cyclase n=1 Tax=Bacillus sp. SG-1 TaxID=161544 RepID=UPI0018DB7E23|nr:diguanylate cyclase [Bacillus sp. SG-1]